MSFLVFSVINKKSSTMKNSILLILSFFIYSTLFGQKIVKEFDVYFDSNSSRFKPEEYSKLKKNFGELTNIKKAYEVKLSGYTDASGDPEKNQILSQRRAASVKNYLVEMGIPEDQVVINYYGSDNPVASNNTDAGKAVNRRTHVEISTKNYQPTNIAGYELKAEAYNFSCADGAKIETKSGSKFNIPKDAFVDKNGNPIEGSVTVEVIEYRDPLDFVFANEPMNLEQDGKIAFFQSDGMFRIEAKQGDEELSLAPGKSIDTELNLKKNQSESRFYAFDDQTKEWNNGQTINQNSLTLGHDEEFENTPDCRRGMVAFKLNSKYTNNEITPDYQQSLNLLEGVDIDSVYRLRKSLFARQARLTKKIKEVGVKIKNKEHRYKLKKVNTKNGKAYFSLNLHRKSNNHRNDETDAFNKMLFEVDKKEVRSKNRRAAFKHKSEITDLKLVENNGELSLTYKLLYKTWHRGSRSNMVLNDSLPDLKVSSVGWLSFYKAPAKRKRALNRYVELYNEYQESFAKLNKKLDELTAQLDPVRKQIEEAQAVITQHQFLKDVSTFAGFSFDKEFTTQNEVAWLGEFDGDQANFNPSISNHLLSSEYANCSFRNNKYMMEQARQDKMKNALDGTGLNVSLSTMGTYNADAIKQLVKPDLIVADYKDENGKKLDIAVIYVFDEMLNGVMRFDGYMDYSPYKFEISKKFAKALIAFDDEMNPYMIPKEDFKKNLEQNRISFVLQKFEKSDSKEDIEQQIQI